MIKQYLSIIIYYILIFVFEITKVLLPLICKYTNFLTAEQIDKYLYSFFRFFAYRGLLITDLERYVELGNFRTKIMKEFFSWKEQRAFKRKDRLKIGFIGNLGRESLLTREFYENQPKDMTIYLYEMDKKSNIFNNKESIIYKYIQDIKPYQDSLENYSSLFNVIENDNLDVLIMISNTYSLPILDILTVPIIISMNTSSTIMPHPKCAVQMFAQPSLPYILETGKIKNIKTNKFLPFPYIYNTLLYNARATTAFVSKDISNRKKQIFFSGNLNKILSNNFFEILTNVLTTNDNIIFLYYGKNKSNILKTLKTNFFKYGILKQTCYGGSYISTFDENNNLIDDGNINDVYNNLFNSRIFMNTFPIPGARSCLEAYFAQVPTITLNFDNAEWLENQYLQPFKLPILITKSGEAKSIKEYEEKCLKVLNDDDFCQTIIDEQNEVLKRVTNNDLFWKKILEMIEKDIELKDI